MKCEKCTNDATVIFNAGSLGRVEKLCGSCRLREGAALDANLVSYTITGLDASLSAAESITHDLKSVVQQNKALHEEILLLTTQNRALRNQLHQTLRDENQRLSELHAQLVDENDDLQTTHVDG